MRRRSPRAFTLMELLLALSVTMAVGLVVTVILGAVGHATSVQADHRRSMVRRQVAIARLGGLIRSAASILAHGNDHLVLWIGDVTEDGLPNISELRLIRYDEDAEEIWSYEAPVTLDPGVDTSYSLQEDFGAVANVLAGTAELPGNVTYRNVLSWDATLDDASVQAARLVRLRVTFACESGDGEAVVVSSLRASG